MGTAKRFEYFNNEHLNYRLVNVHAEGNQAYAEIEILTDNNVFGAQDRIDDVGKASWRRCVTPAQAFPVLRKR